MEKPNLFSIATKELSQDAFITWLLQWADDKYKKENEHLCLLGKEFAKNLIKLDKKLNAENIKIAKVTAGRQWENIDIWAEINDDYALIIEDKTQTGQHDEQLKRYKKIAEDYYKGERKVVCVYIKTGNECNSSLKYIQDNGWYIFSRSNFVAVLKAFNTKNNIAEDFTSYLDNIEKETNSYQSKNKLKTWLAAQGFYLWLEKQVTDWNEWNYVANPSGGFLGFWYYFTACKKTKGAEIYIQLENRFDSGIDLCIKIGADWERTTEHLYKIYGILFEEAKKFNIEITKPKRFKAGAYSTVALVKNAFTTNIDGKLDLDNFLKVLTNTEELVAATALKC